MTLAAGSRFGAYEIVAPLGAGGMGEVYRARDARLGREVALKVLPESFTLDADRLARFDREARLLATLNCPNIAAIYGLEVADGLRALVLELVEGQTLEERIADGALPLAEALPVARQIIDALDAAHERGIVHRDLKPANIKIRPDGTVKVLDFGLAKSDEPSAASMSVAPTRTFSGTRAGVILGTAAYMSPEQARGRAVDKRTDVWACGCVLYEMLSGRRAFEGETATDVIASIVGSEPDWSALPASTPATIHRLLQRLLDKNPKQRVRDIADARFAIDDALTVRDSSVAPLNSSARRWRALALILLAALTTTVAATIALPRRQVLTATWSTNSSFVSQLTNYDGSEAAGSVSPDGRSFVFVSNHGGTPDMWLRQVSGGEPLRLTNDAAVESGPVFAPDGETIYFTRADGAEFSIWRIGALGGQPRKVLNSAQVPSPSPDGRRLAWFATEPNGVASLAVGDIDGGGRRILAQNVLGVTVISRAANIVSRAAWSPDGRRLAYSSGGLFAPSNLFVVNIDDGRTHQVTHFARSLDRIQTQAWLPDNRHLIVSYVTSRAQSASDLGVVDAETGSITRLTLNVAESFDTPSVSVDGTRIVVTATRVQRELWKIPFGADPGANGRGAVRLLPSTQDPMWTYVTRDGHTLLFNNALVGSRNLWMMPLDGSMTSRQITAVAGDAVMHSSLSPDGTHVAFVSNTTGNADIWVQNVDGSDLRQLMNDTAADVWPTWSPDGLWIMYGSLRDGQWETRRVLASGGAPEKVVDGFFRGDWISKADGTGTWIVTSNIAGGLRLVDVDRRTVLWEDRKPGNAMPMFSADGRSVSIPYQESRDRDAIWVYDVATGKGGVAVRFAEPFQIVFRASWVDNDRAFVVNRTQTISHIAMVDKLALAESASPY
jgi:serine/threonine protein kinase